MTTVMVYYFSLCNKGQCFYVVQAGADFGTSGTTKETIRSVTSLYLCIPTWTLCMSYLQIHHLGQHSIIFPIITKIEVTFAPIFNINKGINSNLLEFLNTKEIHVYDITESWVISLQYNINFQGIFHYRVCSSTSFVTDDVPWEEKYVSQLALLNNLR